jgi:acyl carrier protein
MTQDETDRVKSLITAILKPKLAALTPPISDLRDDLDLRVAGLVDSLGFIGLLTELETRLGRQVDIADLAPDQLTTVGPLVRHIAWRRTAS